MNYYELIDILQDLQKYSPRKAAKLGKMIDKFLNEKDQSKKKSLERKINSYVFHLFLSCIDRELGNELYNLNICILEDEYEVEQKEKRKWFINSRGARKIEFVEGEAKVVDRIPREYEQGFILSEDSSDEAKRFFMANHAMLASIARQMDRKEEIVTFYQPKSSRIPREFTEKLVDYVGLPRINNVEDRKLNAK